MLISYSPGEECRVAVVENSKLEEFHAERAASISRVGNIYVGTVTNVEPSIQAAFVDFGVEAHGFLHVSDVHPRYFPGEDEDDTTESIGRKTPRRERPPIQKCFKRGDQIEVQVLKEGVGTKGPTLTSYLSIPGRFLVMMPQMDKVGVSRKVEDEDQRREMRQILDQLDLPDGFGFILRTAGMDRTKTELKRDLSYLARLWKDMEARRKTGHKPRLLYSESDLLVRALRDMVSADISEIIIDNELALARAARFLKIVSPRSKVRLLQYEGQTPLFHAFGIEQQIALMHAREVPLPGGGRLVIDETEALVAIDVNSGKMRDARDAETNAYKTNCEAVEEICRQLKLRDLGGIVINDLIDMRHLSHRKDIEQRFRDRLKRDRAKTTTLAISDFGILEMTRQRMRGSHESQHFVDCPTCRGRGMVQKPDSVAADALRNLAALLDHGNVARVEMVVAPRVASELLSSRRKTLNKLERTSGRHVDVRVSETVPVDRVSFYAYDAQNADIEIESLPRPKPPRNLKVWELSGKDEPEDVWDENRPSEAPESDLTEAEQAEIADMPAHPIEMDDDPNAAPSFATADQDEGGRRGRRRRGRRGRGRGDQQAAGSPPSQQQPPRDQPRAEPSPQQGEGPTSGDGQAPGEEGGRRRRRRRRRRGRGGEEAQNANGAPQPAAPEGQEALLDEGPRGDSWDVEPSAVPPLPAPAASQAEQAPTPPPLPSAIENDQADGDSEDAADQPQSGPGNGEGQQQGEGGGRRRRRRRRGRGGGGRGEGDATSQSQGGGNARQPQQNQGNRQGPPRDGRPPQPSPQGNQPRQDNRDNRPPVRVGGGYQGRTPEPPPIEPKPEAKPKKLLYSSRRKLAPGEAAKMRPQE